MKEKTACIIGVMFAVAIIAFTALKMLPIEVFAAVAGAAMAWLYKTIEEIRAGRRSR